MIRLIAIVLVAALAWMTWWAFGQVAYEKALSGWIDARRAEGWAADVGTLETVGFPNRFDTTLTDVHLADPETGVAWSAPRIQFLSLAYKPHQVIAVLPDAHRLSTPLATYDIAHEDARASLFLMPDTSLALDRARLVISGLDVTASEGWSAELETGRFAAEHVPATRDTYRLGAELDGFRPAEPLRDRLDPAGVLPETVETMHFDATVAFDRPWDRFAIEDRRPQPVRIELADLSARWGEVTFRATGEVEVDADGYPVGEIAVRAVEWRKILRMAVDSGVLPEPAAGPLERALELMSGPRDTLDATLGLRDGQVKLGMIPLGPAPRLVIR